MQMTAADKDTVKIKLSTCGFLALGYFGINPTHEHARWQGSEHKLSKSLLRLARLHATAEMDGNSITFAGCK